MVAVNRVGSFSTGPCGANDVDTAAVVTACTRSSRVFRRLLPGPGNGPGPGWPTGPFGTGGGALPTGGSLPGGGGAYIWAYNDPGSAVLNERTLINKIRPSVIRR